MSTSVEEAVERLRARVGPINRKAGVSRKLAHVGQSNAQSRGADNVDKVRAAIARLGGSQLPGEVIMYKKDGQVMHFAHPKVTVNASHNCTQVTGQFQEKPGDDFSTDKQMLELFKQLSLKQPTANNEDDEEVPDLVPEDFEKEAEQKEAAEAAAEQLD